MSTKTEQNETETLKARVAELEAALNRERKKKEPAGAADESMRETMNNAMDEYAKFFRGMTTAYFEGLRLAAETAASFAKGMAESSQPTKGAASDQSVNSVMDQARDIGTGCTSAFTDAVNQALEVPGKTVDKFYENYRGSSAS
jgi:hypothetical protein